VGQYISQVCQTLHMHPLDLRNGEWVVTPQWNVVLNVTTYTTLRMSSLCYSSHQIIWSHTLCALRLEWTWQECVGCSSVLSTFLSTQETCEMGGNTSKGCDLHLTIFTNLRIDWCFYSSRQIWSHILGALGLGWIGSQCIECVPGLSDLAHAPTRHVEWVVTHTWHVVIHLIKYTNLRMDWCFCIWS